MKNGQKKIFVAMSGGVDSSVAAALLKKQGYDVTGVFVKGWPASPSQGGYLEGMVCGWKEERRDAIRAAAKLNIPFLTFDFSEEYGKNVVEYMKKEYTAGRTPNPDVMCNKYIKFGLFLDKALKMGADCIATGHYVRRSPVPNFYKTHPPARQVKNFEQVRLSIAKDSNKDQSYFLWTLTQKQLKYCLFPIGNYTKPEVRQIARKCGLPTAEKKDSQGLCFVGTIDFASFLRKIIPGRKGEIKTVDGKIVGKHDGAHFYTIGQRHGLDIPGGPYYIVDKDLKNNTLIVAKENNEKKFYKKEVVIDAANWIADIPETKGKYMARIRYRQPLRKCRIVSISGDSATIIFEKPQRAVTPGQSLVLYCGSAFAKASADKEMLGGGIIV